MVTSSNCNKIENENLYLFLHFKTFPNFRNWYILKKIVICVCADAIVHQ